MVTDYITAGELIALLHARDGFIVNCAADVVGRLDTADRLRLSRQPAGRTASTLATKYRAAVARGVRVVGLEELISHLSRLDGSPIRACATPGRDEYVLVILRDDLAAVESTMYVDTRQLQ